MINELGPNDWRFKAIKQEFETGNAQAVGQVVCNNPNAKWEQIEDTLLDANYSDMVMFFDELGLEGDQEAKAMMEVARLKKLAGILKESGEYEYNALMDVVDDMFDPQTEPEMHNRLTSAVEQAYNKGNLDLMGLDTDLGKARETVEMIAQNAGISLDEGMSSQEWDDAKEAERLDTHPEKDKIQGIQDMMAAEEGEKDYFEHLEETPIEVQEIVEKYADDMHLGYEKAQQLADELEQVGWTCDYGLDGIPYNLRELSSMTEGDNSDLSDDFYENEEIDDREDFSVGDYVFVKSQRQVGHIMAFNYNEGLITVRLYTGKAVKVEPADIELMDDDDDEEDHEGTWADFKGDERFFNEEEGKVIPFTPKKEKGVSVDDFDGDLDDYVAKLVAQQTNKGKQIKFTPKS